MEAYVITVKFKRTLSHSNSSRTLAVPLILIEYMEALDCVEVILTLQDRDHIVIELIRPSLPVKEAEEHKDNRSGRELK